jgi:NAD(P)H dehydrogenase (quinone)
MSDTLLVTGASGHLGRLVLDHLLADGIDAGRIVATTRDPSKLADYAARGIEVRKADFAEPASLAEAFRGVDRVALISTDAIGQRLDQHKAAIAAAKAAGVNHIVYTSMPNPTPESLITFAAEHRGTEEALAASGLGYTILRNAWYQENMFMNLPQVLASGQWYTSAGDGKVSHISRDDCAAALAKALAADTTESRTYTLTGPDALTTAEIAAMASAATGKPITVIQLTDDQLAGGMKAAGVPDFLVPFLVGFDANTRVGGADIVTGDFEALTGRKPRPFKTFFEQSKAALLG